MRLKTAVVRSHVAQNHRIPLQPRQQSIMLGTLSGRTKLSLPAVERFIRYSEGFVNDDFMAMKDHLDNMLPMEVLGVRLSRNNLHLLTSFLAAARFKTSEVSTNFQILHHQEHRVWIVPLMNMWKPAFGCPQLLARSGWHSYIFAHGSDDVGLLGVLEYRKMRRSFPDEQYPTTGFYCAAKNDVGRLARIKLVSS